MKRISLGSNHLPDRLGVPVRSQKHDVPITSEAFDDEDTPPSFETSKSIDLSDCSRKVSRECIGSR